MNISNRSLRNRRNDGLELLTSRLGWIFIIKRNKKNISLLVPLAQTTQAVNLSAHSPFDHKKEANERAIG